VGSRIFAVQPGDGSAREQAASCQKVLGGWANIANEYATKRYRSNLINWGMLPFIIDEGELPFHNLDYIFLPGIKKEIEDAKTEFEAYVVKDGELKPFTLKMGELTDDERDGRHRPHESGFSATDNECIYCGRKLFADRLGKRCTEKSGFLYHGKSTVCRIFLAEQRTEKRYFIHLC